MLMKSDISPFDSQETKPYKNDPRVSAMTDLVDAYQRDDIQKYESVLQKNQDVLADPFIAENIDEVTRNMRTKGVLKLIAPYTRFTLAFVAKQLKISIPEVQDIIGFLIVAQMLKGKINQEKGTVEMESDSDSDRTQSMQKWSSAVGALWATILHEGEGFRMDESSHVAAGGGASQSLQSMIADPANSMQGGRAMKGGMKGKGLSGRGPPIGFR